MKTDITIHQAIYGDKNDGYSLLKTTLPDEKLANKICNSTDLSDRGSNWLPAIRGFSYDDVYLVLKTYPDTSPGMRLGRVFSHTFIIQKADIGKINNLRTLFKLFQPEIDKNMELIPLIYNSEELAIDEPSHNRITKVARGLLNEQSVVWIGQDQFPNAVAKIWKNLWDAARFDFSFGINFNPSAVSTSKQNMVCTPETLRSKWQNTKFWVVDVEDTLTTPTPAELYLVNSKNETVFNGFLDQLGTRPKSLKQLSLLERGLDTFNRLESITDFNELYNLYNIILTYHSPAGAKKNLLQKVLLKIIQIIPSLSTQSINALRKLELIREIESLKPELESAVTAWMNSNLFDEDFNERDDTSRLVINSESKESEDWWSILVTYALERHFSMWKENYATTLLKWLNKNTAGILTVISKYFTASEQIEADLESAFAKNKSDEVSHQLLTICIKNGWMKLHARILLQLNIQNILYEQIKVDVSPTSTSGVSLIAIHIDNKRFIRETLKQNDTRLYAAAGEMIVQKKDLLSGFNLQDLGWQKILSCAFSFERDIRHFFNDPYRELVFPLLDLILRNGIYDRDLVRVISQSEYANIQDYSERRSIWEKLPVDTKENFLFSTISALYLKSDFLEKTFEEPLNVIAQTDKIILAFIKLNTTNLGQIVNFYIKYAAAPEKYLSNYLKDVNGNFNGLDAQKLGKLVYNRNWRNCLDIIQNKAWNNQSFKVAFQECCKLLNFWGYALAAGQGLITQINIKASDWWQSIEDLACRLYPEGPIDNRIWNRAGGDESELQHKATGQMMWHKALHKLNNGGAKKITIDKLLIEMKKDFSNNNDLNILIEIKKKI